MKYWDGGSIPLIAPDILGNIISEVSDIGVVIDQTGHVISVLVNPNYTAISRLNALEDRDFRETITGESRTKFTARLEEFLERDGPVRPIELNHVDDSGRWEFPVRYSFHQIGPDGAILMLGRDLRPVAEMQQQLVKAQLALERDYEAHREFETRFHVLMDAATEPMVFVSAQSGQILDANAAATSLLKADVDGLRGTAFAAQFESDTRGDLVDALSTIALSDRGEPLEAKLRGATGAVSLSPTLFRVSGERMLLCRFAFDGPQQRRPDNLTDNLRALFLRTPDGVVFTRSDGSILSANDGFLDIVGNALDVSVQGKALADFMKRGSVDFKVMTENARRSGRMRNYATMMAGDYGSPRGVEISVAAIDAGGETIFAFVVREANRVDSSRGAEDMDETISSVIELVGSATLKEIVAETTNVVEKMCIETALELTMNNRVAAAEMLGLSRQSLYVKLRKFGIMERDTD